MLLTSHQIQLKKLEAEVELQKSRLNSAIQVSSEEIRKVFPPGSISESVIGSVVQEHPLASFSLLFAGGFLAVQFFTVDPANEMVK